MKVLYAEDDIANQTLLSARLRKMGIECNVVDNGITAAESFFKDTYDLVILDEYMPGLNGSDVAKLIREANGAVPIIALTSDDSVETSHLFRRLGFNDILIKPVSKTSFNDVITSYQL